MTPNTTRYYNLYYAVIIAYKVYYHHHRPKYVSVTDQRRADIAFLEGIGANRPIFVRAISIGP